MPSEEFKECLLSIYLGEQEGEAALETLFPVAANLHQQYALGTLLQFETEGKARLRPLLSRLGLTVAQDPEARTNGAALAQAISQAPLKEQFGMMAAGVEAEYLAKYKELATLITPEEDAQAYAIAKFMGDHEEAIMRATANLATDTADPLAPVVDLLQFPLVEPAGFGADALWEGAA